MALVENRFVCDLSKPVQAQALKGNVFSLDNLGSRISVLIYDNGQPATISGSITANCILPDGSTVNINGGLTTENGGSKAYVDVPQSCLLISGILKIAIKCTSSSVITTLAAIVANVYMTKTDNVITPSQQVITDWNAEISAAIATQNAQIAGINNLLANSDISPLDCIPFNRVVKYKKNGNPKTTSLTYPEKYLQYSKYSNNETASTSLWCLMGQTIQPFFVADRDYENNETADFDYSLIIQSDRNISASITMTVETVTGWGGKKLFEKTVNLEAGTNIIFFDDMIARNNVTSGTAFYQIAVYTVTEIGDFSFCFIEKSELVKYVEQTRSTLESLLPKVEISNTYAAIKERNDTVVALTNSNGVFNFSFSKTGGYVYFYSLWGYNTLIGNNKYNVLFENASNDEIEFDVMVSKGVNWTTQNDPHLIETIVLGAGRSTAIEFSFGDYYGTESGDFCYLIVRATGEQSNNINALIKTTVSIGGTQYSEYAENSFYSVLSEYANKAFHAKEADDSERAKNAGWEMISITPAITREVELPTPSPVSFAWNGTKGTVTIAPYETAASNFKLIVISFKYIADYVGHGYKLLFKANNQSNVFPIGTVAITNNKDTGWSPNLWTESNETDLNWEAEVEIDNISGIGEVTKPVLVIGVYNLHAPAVLSETIVNTFEIRIVDQNNCVIATRFNGQIPGVVTNEEMQQMFPEENGQQDMIFWGDSLTAHGGTTTSYSAVCAGLLGKTFKNCGVGGESENTIAARQGGNNLLIPAGNVNGTYSLDQMKDRYGKFIRPLRQGDGSNTVNPILINGQQCTLTISQESSTDPNATYSISGYDGTTLFETTALFNGYKQYGDITVIWVGTNGLETNTIEERISIINSMLSRVGKKYVVLGISWHTEAEMAEDDEKMQIAFGNHFFPTRRMLVNYGLEIEGITPTETDLANIAEGYVPQSLRDTLSSGNPDPIHLNANGRHALGVMLASFIVGLGYAEYPAED